MRLHACPVRCGPCNCDSAFRGSRECTAPYRLAGSLTPGLARVGMRGPPRCRHLVDPLHLPPHTTQILALQRLVRGLAAAAACNWRGSSCAEPNAVDRSAHLKVLMRSKALFMRAICHFGEIDMREKQGVATFFIVVWLTRRCVARSSLAFWMLCAILHEQNLSADEHTPFSQSSRCSLCTGS